MPREREREESYEQVEYSIFYFFSHSSLFSPPFDITFYAMERNMDEGIAYGRKRRRMKVTDG